VASQRRPQARWVAGRVGRVDCRCWTGPGSWRLLAVTSDAGGLAARRSSTILSPAARPGFPSSLASEKLAGDWRSRSSASWPEKQVAVPSSVKLTEAGVPVVVLPYLNAAQGEYPALGEGIERLRGLGVRVLFGPDVLPLHGLARASATSSPGI
jgi:hypothetical protein